MKCHLKSQRIDVCFIWPTLFYASEDKENYGSISLAWLKIEIGFCWSR